MIILNREEIEKLLDLDALVDALAPAMADLSAGRASVPPRIAAHVPQHNGLLAAMPAYVPSADVLACKLVSLYPGNADGPIPTHQAVIIVFDPATGSPTAILDGTYITAARTAAGSALATRLVARKDSHVLAILGAGVQAWSHLRAIPRLAAIRSVRVAARNLEKAERFADEAARESGLPVTAERSWEEALRDADIVCATTHPHEPVVRLEWLKPGVHVNSVGLSAEGREVAPELVRVARVFVEQRTAAAAPMPTGSNDLYDCVREGSIRIEDLVEIGELVSGEKPGRQSESQITLYKSVGVAAQDAAAAGLVLRAYRLPEPPES